MTEQHDRGQGTPLRIRPKTVIGVVIAVLALVFVFQNTGKGQVDFLFWSVSMPAWIWLLVIFAAGVVVGSNFPWLRRRRAKDPG
ncbi:LapA family protein [Solicola gregarius]|uniref:LapA family protein n=1 Tax=Solicola gregarius TaxID=2908642 RepID=A0AA46TMX7_9ACTN|nr:LapA family protein [Solicola gregarius]UYM07328.1 LapA family protein [Solicola gregarius]